MTDLLQPGQPLPDIEFVTESGGKLSGGELTGQTTVLYFYPKDDTPGCTAEACSFRDRMSDYEAAGVRIYGVSLDSPESHRRFREKHNLNFPLLTNEGGRASGKLGVLREGGEKANRVTFRLTPKARSPASTPKSPPRPTPTRSWKTPTSSDGGPGRRGDHQALDATGDPGAIVGRCRTTTAHKWEPRG